MQAVPYTAGHHRASRERLARRTAETPYATADQAQATESCALRLSKRLAIWRNRRR
jgi:hypothetical protein